MATILDNSDFDEDVCSECGDEMDLDGYDGKCGNCCDAELDEEEADDLDIDASTGDYRNASAESSEPYFRPQRLDPKSECPFMEIRSPNPMRDSDFNSPEERVVSLEKALREALGLLAKVRNEYGVLHDDINDLIGEGEAPARLTKDMIPDDYEALTHRLVRCVYLDSAIQDFVESMP